MNRAILTVALVAMTSVGAATSASAWNWGSSSNDIDRTQANQAARINQGVRDGSLTRREADALAAEQRRIQAMENAAKRDGHVSYSERAAIKNAQENASRHIYQERHDSEQRGRWGFRRWW